MRKLLVFLLLAQVWAITVTKSVEGPGLLDINETLDVSLGVSSDGEFFLKKIEDPVPGHFTAVDAPSVCSQEGQMLVCIFEQEFSEGVKVDYRLRASKLGYGVIGTPYAYYAGGVKTVAYMRQYFIGKPTAVMTLETGETLLPGEDIVALINLTNPGARTLGGLSLRIVHSNGTLEESLSLSPGEVLEKKYVLGQAGRKGFFDVMVEASWENGTTSASASIAFIAPNITARRSVVAKWKVEEGELISYVQVSYVLRNGGTATGTASFLSGRELELVPGQSRTVEETHSERAPAEEVTTEDERGVVYDTFHFPEEVPELKKSFPVLIYESVGSAMPPWLVFLVLLGAIYFSTRFENPTIKAGFFLMAFVSVFLLYSQYSVGALRIPEFGSRT